MVRKVKDRLVIIYHTNLSGSPSAGPTYSVPKQIKAQSEVDDVLWINSIDTRVPEWEETGLFHTSVEYGFKTLDDLPSPFNKPDVVVFESFYQPADVKLAKELHRKKTPYVIVPRGAMTGEAQHIKRIKKILGNLLIFNAFAKKAAGIQYLTKKEKDDSGIKWNKNAFVIPNGITIPKKKKEGFTKEKITFSFIGRLALRHKGLDLLIDAIESSQSVLRKNNAEFNIYGPDDSGSVEVLSNMIAKKRIDDLVTIRPGVHGEGKEEILLNTDVFVLTSRFEGHPMGLLEALSYGVPALVTTGTNMSEEVEEANAGWTANCTVDSVVTAITCILENSAELVKKSEKAIMLAKRYRWEKIARESHGEYLDITQCKLDKL